MSVEPLDREFPCGIPPLVNIADGGHGPQTPTERYMVITTHWVGAGDGGLRIDWVLYRLPSEHGHTIHCDLSYHGLVSGGGV